MNNLIVETLTPLNVPVSFQTYIGTAITYVTFFEYMCQGGSFSDNAESSTDHFLQIDVWSKTDYSDIVTQVKTLLTNVNFHRTYETEQYESDVLTFHKIIRMVYNEII
jgi:hypothetical protein